MGNGFNYICPCPDGNFPEIDSYGDGYCNCTEPDPEPIDGGWSDWKDNKVIQTCSESCEQIIEQVRRCDNPKPEFGGKDCSGSSTREVTRGCDPGDGACPINVETKGVLTDDLDLDPNSPEYQVGRSMENLCPQLAYLKKNGTSLTAEQEDLLRRCDNMFDEDEDDPKRKGLRKISPEEIGGREEAVTQVHAFQLGSIVPRLTALRTSAEESVKDTASRMRHPAPGLLGKARPEQLHEGFVEGGTGAIDLKEAVYIQGGAAGDEEFDGGRWGMFINGTGSRGDKDETGISNGFSYDGKGLTLGVDYLLRKNAILGFALGYGASESDIDGDAGSLDSETRFFSLYGTWLLKHFYTDVIIGIGRGEYNSDRYLDYTLDDVRVNQTLSGRTDGNLFYASLGGGKSLEVEKWIFDFSGRFNYLDAKVDGFTETVGNVDQEGIGLPLEIDEQDITSFTSDVNFQISRPFSFNFGVLLPGFNFSYIHEFEDDDNFRARFANDPFSEGFAQTGLDLPGDVLPTIFEVPVDGRDTDYFRAGFSLNAILPHHQNILFNVSTLMGYENLTHTMVTLGYRKDF